MSTIKNKAQDAFYLIDDDGFLNWGKLMTSWDYVSDGEGPKQAIQPGRWLLNTDKDGEVYVKRDCNAFENGKMTYEIRFETLEGDGLYLAFGSRTDAFLTFTVKGETLYAGETEVAPLPYGMHYLKIGFDLTANTASVQLDTKDRGTFAFEKATFPFTCLRIGYGEKDRGAAYLYQSKLYVNYLFNDYNLNPYIGAMPDGYTVKAPKTSSVVSDKRVSDSTPYTYMSHNKKGDTTVTYHAFDKASGKVTFEMKYLLEQADGKVSIALIKGSKPVVTVYDEGEELHCYCGHALRKHHKTVWQTLRMEADTDTGKATIWLNGKKTKVVDFENPAKFVDGFRISYEAYKDSLLMFSDIIAWVKPEEPEDYVPAPVVPKKKGDYVVGMNICSLWREGSHYGWEEITAYPEITPVLGYYDEGSPEVSDWEIKMMAEHGINYEIFCWYPNGNDSKPIFRTHMNEAIVDGYFNARYSDKMKFAIMWENSSVDHLKFEDFKNYTVPYWMEYFFKDERYVKIDNKPLLTVWSLENKFGDVSAKEAFDYVREECRKAGFDGCEILLYSSNTDPAYEASMKASGIDGLIAYHWGTDGSKADVQAKKLTAYSALSYTVPTISVGFDYVGWGMGTKRNGLLDPKDYPTMTEIVKKALAQHLHLERIRRRHVCHADRAFRLRLSRCDPHGLYQGGYRNSQRFDADGSAKTAYQLLVRPKQTAASSAVT